MTQCPYIDELYRNEEKNVTVGKYGDTLIGTGQVPVGQVLEYIDAVAETLELTELVEYNVMEDANGTVAVTLGLVQITEAEMWQYLRQLYDQDLACANCHMSRAMDEYHKQTPRVPEKVKLGPNQILAYGSVQDLMTYEQAKEHIMWYLERTGDQGEAMLADIGYSGYEIVLRHVQIGETHYAGEDDYVSVETAERLVAEGLAYKMQFE